MTEPVLCDRCGQPANAQRTDVGTPGDLGAWLWGRITCTTPGCVDERGSTWVDPPDEPGKLTREDRRWIRRHQELIREYGRVERALREATA